MAYSRALPKPLSRKLLWGAFLGGWLSATVWGIVLLADYSFQPGESGLPGDAWPAGTQLRIDEERVFTLVVGLHPNCPCSRATLDEIETMLAARPEKLRVQAVFVDEGAATLSSELWLRVQRMPGVKAFLDRTGDEARRFSLRTSGETRLFAPNGALCFRGGVTLSRGHAGSNPGRAAVLAAIDAQGRAAPVFTPVFGCALFGPGGGPDES